jgi:hypothetical protein
VVRYDIAGLTEIASGKDNRARTWLKRFLTQVHDTPEVLKLKDLLRKCTELLVRWSSRITLSDPAGHRLKPMLQAERVGTAR